jgi:hypothetical protein
MANIEARTMHLRFNLLKIHGPHANPQGYRDTFMVDKVFYSWQSDLPNATNRGFIQRALENAVKTIRDDDTLEIQPVVERDTLGIPGSPDIANTIFAKIDEAAVFVCDVSIVTRGRKYRPAPNPNVLIELGYAVRALGWHRILLVMNLASGKEKELPFDLGTKRAITYNMQESAVERVPERKQLESKLSAALKTVFMSLVSEGETPAENIPSLVDNVIEAIHNSRPNQAALVRQYMEWLTEQVVALAPDFSNGVNDDLLVEAISKSEQLVIDYGMVTQTSTEMGCIQCLDALYQGFTGILNHYRRPSSFSGTFYNAEFDFYKFIAHELMVMLCGLLIKEERWDTIGELLARGIYVENTRDGVPSLVQFGYISEYLESLDHRNDRLHLGRACLHSDLLNERHTSGEIGTLMPMQRFVEADYFLFLRAAADSTRASKQADDWVPWTALYLDEQIPRYLVEATNRKYAEKLLLALNLQSVEDFQSLMQNYAPRLRDRFSRRNIWFHPLEYFNPQSIGSQ